MARKAKTTTAKAVAPVVEEKKTAVSETVETKAVEVKEEAPAVEAPVAEAQPERKKPGRKPAAKKVEEKPAAKKPAAKKTTTKKAEPKSEVFVQYSGKSYSQEELLKIAKDVWQYDLNQKVEDLKSCSLYVKPEENAVYYVMNEDVTGYFAI